MMNTVKYFLIVCCTFVFCNVAVKAQQMPQFTNYQLNSFIFNPAFAGKNNFFEVTTGHRSQWTGITDAPRTYTLSLTAPSKNQKMGFGGYLYTDIVGPTRRIGVQGAYAYHVKLNSNLNLSLAASAGILQFSIDGSQITLRDEGDQAMINSMQSELVPDANFGTLLYNEKFYAGISVNQLFNNKLSLFPGDSDENRLALHYYLTGAYKFEISEDFTLEPSALVKYVNPVPVKIDLSLRGIYKDLIWIGGTWRSNDAAAAMAGFVLNNSLKLGYSYDFTTSDIKNYTDGTHEIVLSVSFKRKAAVPIIE